MTTLSELVDDSYGLLYGIAQAERPQEDTLAAELASSSDNVEMATPDLWKRGDYAESPSGELVIFAENAPSSGAADVRRAQRGTSNTAPYSSGTVWFRNPTYPRHEIERIVYQIIRNDLWPHVWTWHKDTVSFVATQTAYPLDEFIDEVVRVSQYDLASDGRWYPFDRNTWDTERQLDSTVATNGSMLRLYHVKDDSETVYYTAKRRPHINDLGNLSEEITEMIPWAVVGKLAAGARATATRHNPNTDRNEELEGGYFRDYRGFMSEFLRMRSSHNGVLLKDVPPLPVFRPRRRRRVG